MSSLSSPVNSGLRVPLWRVVLLGAAAGGLGWGIRGQYGHETGAMMAGLLVCLTLSLSLARHLNSGSVAKAVAWGAIAMGLGGSMTYGQTVGLTHDPVHVGHWEVLRWGMLGLGIKGALWIGFGGTFLGMGLGGTRYRVRELALVWLGLLGLCASGIGLFNEPYDPSHRILPRIYFSADWRWLPDAVLKPRREVWGGFLLALAGLLAWTGVVRRDGLAWRMGLWGCLGGAVGFPLGQCIQAFHAWNPQLFVDGWGARIASVTNWWNFMETTFGATMGGMLALGLWIHRWRIREAADDGKRIHLGVEWIALGIHTVLLAAEEFTDQRWAAEAYDFGLLLGFIPLVLIAGGRLWPWWVMFPLILLPIAGKTFRNLAVETTVMSGWLAMLLFAVVPLVASIGLGEFLRQRSVRWGRASGWLPEALVFAVVVYFGLNFAFFQWPWPWLAWTARTPNALVFAACAMSLIHEAVRLGRQRSDEIPAPRDLKDAV